MASNSTGEGSSQSSIDPPDLIDALKQLLDKVALLERDNERLRAENEEYKIQNSPQSSSIDPSELIDVLKSLPTKVAAEVELRLGRLRDENEQQKKEINQMSSTFKTVFALKNRKIKDLEALMDQLLNGKEGEVSNSEVKKNGEGPEKTENETAVVFSINDKLQRDNVKHVDTRHVIVTECGIRAKLADISKLDDKVISIGTIELHRLAWIILAYKHHAHLGFLLVNNDLVSNGFPTASVTLISSKSSDFNYSKRLPNLKKLNKYCVCSKFILLKDLFDEKKGFVKGDAVIVDVIIKPANNVAAS